MKKFTSLMLMLLFAVTTWGQNVVTSTAENPVYYTIASYNRGGVITYSEVGNAIVHDAYNTNGNSSWYFEAVENNENNGVYIVNKNTSDGNKLYIGSDKTVNTTPAVWYILGNGVNEYGFVICSGTATGGSNCLDASNSNTSIGGWNPSASDWEGTTWCFMGDFTNETYNPNAFTTQQGTSGRNITSITINNTTKSTRSAGFAFADYTRSHEFSVLPGEETAISIARNGNWMNAFVYIDFENNGFATDGVAEDGYTPTGDLVSYSAYNADPDNGTWYKSNGTTPNNGNTVELPSFTAPETTGKYRLRVKYDWNDLDPNGGAQFTTAGSQFIDITLNVVSVITEPEYITNAKALLAEAGLETIALQVKDQNAAGYIWANTYAAGSEGIIDYLVDGKNSTFFHTSWSDYATDGTKDYLEVDLGADNSIKNLVFDYVTRADGQTDFPQSVTIKGSNDKSVYEDIATISEGLPIGNTKTYASDVLTNGKEYRYIRFQVNSTTRGDANIPYFHLAEINFYKVADDFTNDYITELTGINRAVKNPEATETSVAAAIENYNMAPYPNTLAGFTNTKCYTITTKNRGGWAVSNDGTFGSYNQAGEIGDDYKKFAVLTLDNENYYLFNVGANKFVKYDCTTVEGPGTTIAIADASAQGAKRIRVNFNTENAYININPSNNLEVNYWLAIDEGNAVLFTPAGDFDSAAALEMLAATADAIALQELIEEIEGLNITSGANIGDYTEATVTALTEALATAKGLTEVTAADVEALQAAYNALAIVLPDPAKVYALNSYKDYLFQEITGSTDLKSTATSNTDTRALWQVVEAEGGFKIKNIHTGLFIGNNAKMGEEGVVFVITKTNIEDGATKSADEGNVFIKFPGETTNCLHSTVEVVKPWAGAGAGNQYAFEEVSEFSHTLTVSEAGYATLMLGFNATIPAGVECYYAVEAIDENGVLNLTKVEGTLPGNTAVIVKLAEGYAAGSYEFAYTDATATVSGNLLSGTLYTKSVPATAAYVLSAPEGKVGLYKATLTDGAFQNNANKAFFKVETANGIASYSFNFDWEGTTGIDGVVAEGAENGAIYDITGRRVKAITAPGIYIVNGKKVVK